MMFSLPMNNITLSSAKKKYCIQLFMSITFYHVVVTTAVYYR